MNITDSPSMAFPDDAVTQTFAILAKRGGGKSNTAAAMAEEMQKRGDRFVAIDPVGSWWGLRTHANGRSPGLGIPVFGGRHGDIPLPKTAGALIGQMVAEENMTCVLDTSEFSEGDKTRFLIDFAETLYRKNTTPLHLFLEEADDYIPQRPFREQARLVRSFENIVRRGRARGLGITMITQRSAAINKNVLTQIETLIVLRTTSPQDRNAIEAWVRYHGQSSELLKSLATLGPGDAWIWSPHWLGKTEKVHIRRRWTFDSGATPEATRGATKVLQRAEVDLDAVKRRMAETLERVKADDPAELRREIADLKKRLAEASRVPERVVEREVQAIDPKAVDRLEKLTDRIETVANPMVDLLQKIRDAQDRISAGVAAAKAMKAISQAFPPSPPPRRSITVVEKGLAVPVRVPKSPAEQKPRRLSSGPLISSLAPMSGPEERILNALAWFAAFKVFDPTEVAVAAIAGYSAGGGAWKNPRGRLRQKGLIEYIPGGRLGLTAEGVSAAPVRFDTPLSNEEVHRRVLEKMPTPQRRILEPLIAAWPGTMTDEEVARVAGYEPSGGAYKNPRGRLRTMGFIEYRGTGVLAAAQALFPFGEIG